MPVDVSGLQKQNSNDFRLIDLDRYTNDAFTLLGFKLSTVLDDIILVQYADLADDTGDTVMRNGIAIPLAMVAKAWRIGLVVLAGPNCKHVKSKDYVCFPNDKGIPCSNLDVDGVGILKDAVFLNENRIFGVCKPIAGAKHDGTKATIKGIMDESKSSRTKRRSAKQRGGGKVRPKKS
jgi:hypothetical protein